MICPRLSSIQILEELHSDIPVTYPIRRAVVSITCISNPRTFGIRVLKLSRKAYSTVRPTVDCRGHQDYYTSWFVEDGCPPSSRTLQVLDIYKIIMCEIPCFLGKFTLKTKFLVIGMSAKALLLFFTRSGVWWIDGLQEKTVDKSLLVRRETCFRNKANEET